MEIAFKLEVVRRIHDRFMGLKFKDALYDNFKRKREECTDFSSFLHELPAVLSLTFYDNDPSATIKLNGQEATHLHWMKEMIRINAESVNG